MTNTETREQWLRAAVEVFRPRFEMVGHPLPEKIRVSIGFGGKGARYESKSILGVTYKKQAAADGVNEIFISPEDASTISMLETVLHELIHVADDCASGHKGTFAEIATRLGFEGPMTSTPSSVELQAELITIEATLGQYPGSYLVLAPVGAAVPVGPDGKPIKFSSAPGTQTTRMIKRSCVTDECEARGYSVRLTQKWLLHGSPLCPVCAQPMGGE